MRTTLLPLFAAALLSSPVDADPGLTVFDLAPGARYTAMGTAGTADDADPAGILLNPAAATVGRGVAVNSGYGNWSGDVDHFVNAVTWAAGAGPLIVGGGLAHSRLDFKTFTAAYDYLPYNTQSSFMTAAAAARWNGVAAGVALDWDAAGERGDEVLFDAGVSVRGPEVSAGMLRVGYVFAVASLRNGAETGAVAGTVFSPGAGGEQLRYGVSVEVRAGAVGARINADAVDAGQDGSTDATAAGVEVTLAGIVHLRAGYGDGTVGPHGAVSFGAGAGYRVAGVALRLDYARIKSAGAGTDGDDLSANVFGADIGFDFGATETVSSR